MKILVVSRLKSNNVISIITQRQMNSIEKLGHDVSYFMVETGGLFGYFNSLVKLRKLFQKEVYDVVHAHYSLCGIIASLAGAKSLVVSLMGSDTKNSIFNKLVINYFTRKRWTKVIVKSDEMLAQLKVKKSKEKDIIVLPNGVDFEIFQPIDKFSARKELGWNQDKKIILFGADPSRTEKRFDLAKHAINSLINYKILVELKVLNNVLPEQVPLYLNGCDVVLLTSNREGSPNIIKEAMACNLPVVTTNVGDVEKTIGNTLGCIIVSDHNSESISLALSKILSLNIGRTKGRENIEWLSDSKIAEKLIEFYAK